MKIDSDTFVAPKLIGLDALLTSLHFSHLAQWFALTKIENTNLLGLIALLGILVLAGCETTKSKVCPYSDNQISNTQQKAEGGDATAQYSVAVWHQIGGCLPHNFPEAMSWYHRSAEQGYLDAQLKLSEIYLGEGYRGYGQVSRDESEAEKWLIKAAEQGSVDAARRLGDIYYEGKHKPPNLGEAEKWYQAALALDKGNAYSKYRHDKIKEKTDPNWVRKQHELKAKKQQQEERERLKAETEARIKAEKEERIRQKRLEQKRKRQRLVAKRHAQNAKAQFHSIEVVVEEGKSSKRKRIKAPSPVVKGIKNVAKAIVVIPASTVGYGLVGVLAGAAAGPPGAAAGGVLGSVQGLAEGVNAAMKTTPAEQKAKIKAARSALKQTLSQKDFVRDLKAQLLTIATQQQAGDLLTDTSGAARYRLNVEIVRFGLIVKDRGEGRIRAAIKANLMDKQNNGVLQESQICYVSAEPRSITEWSGDTKLLEQDLKDAYTNLSNQILTEVIDLAEYPDTANSWADTHKVCESKTTQKGTALALTE